jgi:protoheme IX farnesyltransferase
MQHRERPTRPPPLPCQIVVLPDIVSWAKQRWHDPRVARITANGQTRSPFGLLRATHPEPAAAVTLVAGGLALAVGHDLAGAALVAATVAASQLAVGWTNDAVDAPRDAAVGRAGKPIVEGRVSRRTVAVAAAIAAATTVGLALAFPPAAGAVAVVGLVSALGYDWPLKLTPWSVIPYAVSFAALPGFVVLALPETPPWWLVVAGGLLGAGAHFANALPDLADDAATGVRGLPQRLGGGGSALAAAVLLLAATAVLVFGPPGTPSWPQLGALAVAVVALPVGWRAGRLFRAFMAVALIDVGLLLAGGTVL